MSNRIYFDHIRAVLEKIIIFNTSVMLDRNHTTLVLQRTTAENKTKSGKNLDLLQFSLNSKVKDTIDCTWDDRRCVPIYNAEQCAKCHNKPIMIGGTIRQRCQRINGSILFNCQISNFLLKLFHLNTITTGKLFGHPLFSIYLYRWHGIHRTVFLVFSGYFNFLCR